MSNDNGESDNTSKESETTYADGNPMREVYDLVSVCLIDEYPFSVRSLDGSGDSPFMMV